MALGWGEVEALRRVAARVLAPGRLEEALVFSRELSVRGFTSRMSSSASHVVFDLYDEAGDSEGFDELEEAGAKASAAGGGGGKGGVGGVGGAAIADVRGGIDGPLYDFLQAVGLANLGTPLGKGGDWTLAACVTLLEADRTRFLQQLKDGGVEKLVDRQALANAIAKALRAGWLKPPYRGPFTEAGRALRSAREAQPNAAAPQLPPGGGGASHGMMRPGAGYAGW